MARAKAVDLNGNPIEEEQDILGGSPAEAPQDPVNNILGQVDPTEIPTKTDWPIPTDTPEPDVHRKVPGPIDPQNARSAESPRENAQDRIQATRRRPSEPSPMSGSFFTAGGGRESAGPAGGNPMGSPAMGSPAMGSPGVMPFSPMAESMGDTDLASPMAESRGDIGVTRRAPNALFGSMGGLQGGGLGVPLDPMSNATSDPISSLIESLLKNRSV